ncbi:MAG: hypothetical protein KAU35_07350 [candidate division Zixibacteria bacterium]|nr:hypothetical protein [candidate division Zixibacteria bacterium]
MGIDTVQEQTYRSLYKSELLAIAAKIAERVDKDYASKDWNQTPVLCRYFLITIFEIIRACFGCLEIRNRVAQEILSRSIVEYNIDLHYLALKDDIKLNRRFVNYYKLWLYWHRDKLKYHREYIPWSEEQYQAYVLDEFQDEMKNMKPKQKTKKQPKEKPEKPLISVLGLDQHIKDKYMKSWCGMNFPQRIEEIETLISKHYPERLQYNDTPKLRGYLLYFYSYSNYTHPSPFAVLPNLAPKPSDFDLHHGPTDDQLQTCEEFLIQSLYYAVQAFADSLTSDRSSLLMGHMQELVSKSPNTNRYFSDGANRAISPRNEQH